MKKKLFYLLTVSIMSSNTSCADSQKSQTEQSVSVSIVQTDTIQTTTQTDLLTENEAIIQMLMEFYTKYITACSQLPTDIDAERLILEQFCTSALLDNLYHLSNPENPQWIDYDPFLNAQDCDLEMLKTLQINKDEQANIYNVTYQWNDYSITIRLSVVKTDNGYKIDAILR